MTGAAVFGGALIAFQVSDTTSGRPALRHGRDIGQDLHALVGGDRQHARLAALMQLVDRGELDEAQIDMAGDQIGERARGAALVGHVDELAFRSRS